MRKSLCLFYIPRRRLSINLRNLNNLLLYCFLKSDSSQQSFIVIIQCIAAVYEDTGVYAVSLLRRLGDELHADGFHLEAAVPLSTFSKLTTILPGFSSIPDLSHHGKTLRTVVETRKVFF